MTLGLIPTTDYATPASTEGAVIIRDLIQRYDALILQRHGSVTVARTPFEAYLKLEKLESAANITRMLVQLGQASPFPPEEVGKLVQWRHDKGVMKPGQAAFVCATANAGSPRAEAERLKSRPCAPNSFGGKAPERPQQFDGHLLLW